MAKGSVYEGKTYDEAVRKGLDELGLQRAEATITTIEEGKNGFLGFGARPFRVSVTRRPGGAIREPEETRGGDRRGGRGGREERGGRGGRGGREERPSGGRGERSDKGGRGERGGRGGRDASEERKGGERRPEPVRAEAVVSTERAERPERADRPERGERRGRRGREGREGREPRDGAREVREPRDAAREVREPREAREAREPREERRPQPPVAAVSPAPIQSANGPAAESDEDGAAGERRRRRRGRRGGRGRRREGRGEGASAHAGAGAPMGSDADMTNGAVMEPLDVPVVARERVAAPAAAPVAAPAPMSPVMQVPAPVEPEPVAAMASHDAFPAATPMAAAPAPRAPRPTRHQEEPEMGSEELAATAKRVTEDLLKAMGYEATITATADHDRVDVTVQVASGEHLLNGTKGETRQALQHLLNRFVNRGEGSRYHLQLEINDFWQQREKELEDMALEMATAALAENAEKVTDFLNSQERRIIHVTLKPDSRVKTYALGNGMIKRVAIAPADFPERTEEDAG